MERLDDLRASKRIHIASPVEVATADREAQQCAVAVNVSLGGLLLSPTPPLAVGSPCRLAFHPSGEEDGKDILVEGTVVRKGPQGAAIRFARQLDHRTFEAVAKQSGPTAGGSLLRHYRDYFRVSQQKDHAAAERLLHVSPQRFRSICLTTLLVSIPVAALPVWALRDSITTVPNWLKVSLSFVYAGAWLFIVQPSIDLLIFRFRNDKRKA